MEGNPEFLPLENGKWLKVYSDGKTITNCDLISFDRVLDRWKGATQKEIYTIILDLFFTGWYCSFTTNGEGEHARHTSRKVATSPGRRKPAAQYGATERCRPPVLRLPSRTRERRATGWRGEDRPRRDGGRRRYDEYPISAGRGD